MQVAVVMFRRSKSGLALTILMCVVWVTECKGKEKATRGKLFDTDLTVSAELSTFRENYLNIGVTSQGVNAPYDNVTYCFRWQLSNWIPHCLFQEKNIGFSFSNPEQGFGFIYINGLEFMFKLKDEMTPYIWYHICVAYESNSNAIKMFVNSDKVMNESLNDLANLPTKGIQIMSDLVLGSCRELDSDEPHKKIARVWLQDFNMWSTFLTDEEILQFTEDCINPQTYLAVNMSVPQLISWKSLNILQQGTSVDDKGPRGRNALVGNRINETILMMPLMKRYDMAKMACEHFGGNMIFLDNVEMLQDLNSSEFRGPRGILNRFKIRKGKTIEYNEMSDPCRYKFWMPIVQEPKENESQKHSWYFDGKENERASFLPWKLGQPNGLDVEKCVVVNIMEGTYEDVACSEEHCNLCTFENQQKFNIRGFEKMIRHKRDTLNIDTEYVFLPRRHYNPTMFMLSGYLYSDIIWNVIRNQWSIRNSDTKAIVAFPKNNGEKISIGKHEWDLKFGSTSKDIATFNVKLTQVKQI